MGYLSICAMAGTHTEAHREKPCNTDNHGTKEAECGGYPLNPSTQKAEAGGFNLEINLTYRERACPKTIVNRREEEREGGRKEGGKKDIECLPSLQGQHCF